MAILSHSLHQCQNRLYDEAYLDISEICKERSFTGGRFLIDGQKNKTADCIACTQSPPKQALRRRFFCRVGAWRLQS
ncbi:hypothetical protein E1A91_A12G020300v1 [Gossypium mustelinum]|uniref:Uncharacterized protein n=3 Tax=Gossypium TaxID=3633 RepID=A0A5J5T4W5_GOSBA|nr:hypothetical protein ES319_A12G019400v1 [Gossypium barbadense]TYG88420.1 hypothetical protein ES288_A12G019800v1 [Gossypium darwinii]TYJ03332.1 hypothetical protein E1A91_A12G020300v1 [Gossypium mustelinum]